MDAPPAGFSSVVPDRAYTTDEVADLFRRTPATIRRWLRAGVLRAVPRVCPRGPQLVLGSELRAKLGGLVPEPPVESKTARRKRAERLRAEIRALAGKRPA